MFQQEEYTGAELLRRFGDLGISVEEANQDEQISVYQQQLESPHLQQSVSWQNEDNNPLIISNIHQNFRMNLDKILIKRALVGLKEVKKSHLQLIRYLQNQRIVVRKLKEELLSSFTKLVQEFWMKQQNQQRKSQELEMNKFLEIIKQKDKETSRLLQNLSLKNQQQIRKTHENNVLSSNCPKCSTMESKIALQTISFNHLEKEILQLKNQLQAEREEIIRLQKELQIQASQAQQLQENIFDLQQKVAGIDLEVEKRFKEKSLILAQRLDVHQIQNESILKLNKQIQTLVQKCRRYESICISEHQLARMQKIINQKSADQNRLQTSLIESRQKLDQELDKLYHRQHKLLMQEKDIDRRFQQVQKRQQAVRLNRISELNRIQSILNNGTQKKNEKQLVAKDRILQGTRRNQQWNIHQNISKDHDFLDIFHVSGQKVDRNSTQRSHYNYQQHSNYEQWDEKERKRLSKRTKTDMLWDQRYGNRISIEANSSRNRRVGEIGVYDRQRHISPVSRTTREKSKQIQRPSFASRQDKFVGVGTKLQRLRDEIKRQIRGIK